MVKFNLPVTVGEIIDNGDNCSVQIINDSENDVPATLCAVLYDGDRLALVNAQSVTVNPGEIEEIVCKKPEIPYYVKNPVIKTYLLR